MILPLEERLKKYTMEYMFGAENDYSNSERGNYWKQQLKGCMASAVGYAFGYKDYDSVKRAHVHWSDNKTYSEQIYRLLRRNKRNPERVIDMGTGRGELPFALSAFGVNCMGVDPMPEFLEAVNTTNRVWGRGVWIPSGLSYLKSDMCSAVDKVRKYKPDTFIMCETLEHIPEEEFKSTWDEYVAIFKENKTLFIVTNWITYMPLMATNNWEHVWSITEEVYDWLSSYAKEVVYREGAHLVLQF